MSKYYVNKNGQDNGDHEVHIDTCKYLPNEINRIYLGDFSNCVDALNKAKTYYTQANGCKFCALPCHTS